MALLRRSERLKKELGLFDVYVIATGATLSSGFFLLRGLAAASVGNALPLSYRLAGLLLLPELMCKAELSTAMPRAGGIHSTNAGLRVVADYLLSCRLPAQLFKDNNFHPLLVSGGAHPLVRQKISNR